MALTETTAGDGYADLARFVANGSPHVWVEYALRQFGDIVAKFRQSDESAPSRKDLRDQLEMFARACGVVSASLNKRSFNAFLPEQGETKDVSAEKLSAAVEELEKQAKRALVLIPGGGGRNRAYRPGITQSDIITGQQFCAWTIIQAMTPFRGHAIGPDNPDAQEAMNTLWALTGGIPLGESGGLPTGWRDHIIAVRTIEKLNDRRARLLRSYAAVFQAHPPAKRNDLLEE